MIGKRWPDDPRGDRFVFRYLLVDEFWTHLGWFESERPDWSVEMSFVAIGGASYSITGVVPNPNPGADYTATWTVGPA